MRFVKELATSEALDAYLHILQNEDCATKTISTRMGVVFSMLKDHRRETGVEYPSKLLSLPDVTEETVETYSDEQIIQLFSAMNPEEKARYLFFLHTGCREQEVMYATWDDVDFRQRKFRVTGKSKRDVNSVPKNHEQRWIPLTTELFELLKDRKAEAKHRRWIFVNENRDPEGHFLRKFKAIAKRAGLNCGHCKTTIKEGTSTTCGKPRKSLALLAPFAKSTTCTDFARRVQRAGYATVAT